MTHPETQAIHSGQSVDPATRAVTPNIVLSSTFERATDGSYPAGYLYSRYGNPNRNTVEAKLSDMEGGADSAAFASGLAASMAILHSLQSGDHVLAPDDLYFGVRVQLTQLYARWGLQVSFVDMSDLSAVRQALQANTRLVWLETPSNPLLKISDIAAVAELAHGVGALCAVDNTWATPLLQKPLALGADLAVHSTTKYLGGHSDLLGGMVVTRQADDTWARIRQFQKDGGAVPSPFDCWLLGRSIATLPQRLAAHCANAQQLVNWLVEHPAIEAVHYPSLPSHAGHEIAQRQMSDFGGMLSIRLRGGEAMARAVANRVQVFTQATSLGGVESLIEHRASVEGPASQTPRNLLRISVGLENVADLIADLAQALDRSV
ncbi:MAG TPA: PLP-dependent aspartate aminotransferase family protein [Anaerolineales bacterium]|nr:PLP-dependent aspartate aminotransferase family protein [Anaerolineales bacterium]